VAEFVNLEVRADGVGVIRLDRPKVNALNRQVVLELGEELEKAAAADGVRALVLWGGERVFAAGADIKEMTYLDPVAMHRYIGLYHEVFTFLERLPKVTIAAINGFALGGGCELALACDFRVGASDCALGQPEIALGIMPGAGGTQRLPRLVGVAKAKDLIFSGRRVRSGEALDIGLLDRAVDPGEVLHEAVELATRYARGPALALAGAKGAIARGLEMDIDAGLLLERQTFSALFATEDQRIGMTSFAERGPGKATFVGR
jgi:enoyl-CoA hydratase/carnithine racemase